MILRHSFDCCCLSCSWCCCSLSSQMKKNSFDLRMKTRKNCLIWNLMTSCWKMIASSQRRSLFHWNSGCLNKKSRNSIQRWKSYCMKSCLSWNFPLSCNLMNNMLGCSRSGNCRSSWRNKTSLMDCLMKSYRKMMLEKSFCLKMTKVGLNCLTLSNCS